MKRALVLSGGGAKGAFEVGALEVLIEEFGQRFDLLFGVSVGALVAAVLAKYFDDPRRAVAALREIWLTISESDVHKKYSWAEIVVRFAVGKLGIYDNAALRKTIEKHIGKDPVPAHVGYVDLLSGEYKSAFPALPVTIHASATMPVIWPPVNGELVDGGVRNVTPLADAIDAGADEIVVILCNPLATVPAPRPKNLLDVVRRSLSIAMHEIAQNDLRETLRINELLAQAREQGVTLKKPDGTPYRHVKITVIEPPIELGDTLDFSQPTIRWRMGVGRAAAREVLRRSA